MNTSCTLIPVFFIFQPHEQRAVGNNGTCLYLNKVKPIFISSHHIHFRWSLDLDISQCKLLKCSFNHVAGLAVIEHLN